MSKKRYRWSHRHIERFVKFMSIIYTCAVIWTVGISYLISTKEPPYQLMELRYIILLPLFVSLYFSWRKHLLFLACGLGGLLCLVLSYQCIMTGISASTLFFKIISFVAVFAVLGPFGWMFVWYPVKLIKYMPTKS